MTRLSPAKIDAARRGRRRRLAPGRAAGGSGVFCCIAAAALAASAPSPTSFGCDAPGGRSCYFSIQFAFGGVRSFSLRSGERTTQYGLTPGADRYQMSLDLPNFGDVNRCRVLSVQGHACTTKAVDAGYND